MKKYNLTSVSFAGNLVLGYSDEGYLVLFDNTSEMSNKQQDWLLANFPIYVSAIETVAQQMKAKLELMPEDLSFDTFWRKYGRKINLKRCKPLWERMTDTKRAKAIKSIDPYKAYLQRTGYRGQVDPENYLKNEYYDTDWNREK